MWKHLPAHYYNKIIGLVGVLLLPTLLRSIIFHLNYSGRGRFFSMRQPRHLFVYFRSFQTQIYRKNFRLQRDLNLDCRSRRQARWPLDHHHGLDFSLMGKLLSWQWKMKNTNRKRDLYKNEKVDWETKKFDTLSGYLK